MAGNLLQQITLKKLKLLPKTSSQYIQIHNCTDFYFRVHELPLPKLIKTAQLCINYRQRYNIMQYLLLHDYTQYSQHVDQFFYIPVSLYLSTSERYILLFKDTVILVIDYLICGNNHKILVMSNTSSQLLITFEISTNVQNSIFNTISQYKFHYQVFINFHHKSLQ